MHVKYLILGAGPTGLGAAHRLKEMGENDFLVLEAAGHAGGLSASFLDEKGFTWDIGGHVIFSHYPYFDNLLESLLGSDYLTHTRIATIRAFNSWVPYPYQNNIRHLPPEVQWECVEGLLPGQRPNGDPQNFKEWINTVFGSGLAKRFMLPYNYKVWAYPPELMSYKWIGERVSIVDLGSVLKNLVLQNDNVTWGPNSTFKFPLSGGTGQIFRKLANSLGARIKFNSAATELNLAKKEATTITGEKFSYTFLLSTAPLDLLMQKIITSPPSELVELSKNLEHNGVHVTGVGTSEERPDNTCWMYFPEDNAPFYRVTNLHNYSPNNIPQGAKQGLLTEVSFSEHKKEDPATLTKQVVNGLVNTGLLTPKALEGQTAKALEADGNLHTFSYTANYAYPVPTPKRDSDLKAIHPYLQKYDVYSRGRFGGWKYEVGNMDHSVMQGVEWADFVLSDKPETTY